MTVPDLMPILSVGTHTSPAEGACIMEYASMLAGEPWTDSPACTHPVLAQMARSVNDRLDDDRRQELLPLLPRLMGTAEFGTEHERRVLSVRLAAWCARQVLPLAADRVVAEAAIAAAEGWCDGRATGDEARSADNAAYAAYAAAYAYGDDLVELLTGLLDEYDRLTGRTEYYVVTSDDLARLAAATA